jgi:hypothetical protein
MGVFDGLTPLPPPPFLGVVGGDSLGGGGGWGGEARIRISIGIAV